MQLFHGKLARKVFGLAALLLFSVPFGLTVTGCKHAIAVEYCNGGDSGPQLGQVASISLSQSLATYGESLSYGQIGQSLSASALDCKGNSVSVSKFVYASTNGYVAGAAAGQIYADINPSTGAICAGTWNRQTGGSVSDYTVCTPPTVTPANYIAYVTATAEGATSNAIPVFIHAQPTSIAIGSAALSCIVTTQTVTGATNGTSTVTLQGSTAGLVAGETVSGASIPANTLVTAVNAAANTATLFQNASATATNVTLTQTVNASTTNGSTAVTVTSAADIATGSGISGAGIPAGTSITGITGTTLTLSSAATATDTNVNLTIGILGSITTQSESVTVGTTTGLAVGEGVSGAGIPANTSISAIGNGMITLSNPATATATNVTLLPTVLVTTTGGSPTITAEAPADITVGLGISGAGIQTNTVIQGVNEAANTLTLSLPATATSSNVALTIIGNPTTNCCPVSYTAAQPTATYDGTSCISQGQTAQIVTSLYKNGDSFPADNITCQVGHVVYSVTGATTAVTFDQNGVGTANQPGSATITAAISGSGSSSTAGFWSTCPPATITLNSNGNYQSVTGLLNVATPFTAVVTDTKGITLSGVSLEYESTTPETIPGGSNTITPTYPGTTTITAVCAPPTCNASPYSQIGLYSNGTTLTSNGVKLSATGQSSSVIYVGSTNSQYLYPYDFTTNKAGALLKLPYTPNSMVISVDGSTIYLGGVLNGVPVALMTVSTATNTVTGTNVGVTGSVISIAPNGSTIVVTDPLRETVSLVSSAGAVETQQGGVATSAAWSPDSSTVYITTKPSNSYPNPQVMVYNSNTSWTVTNAADTYTGSTVTVPHIGAYLAGGDTEGRSYCPSNTLSGTTTPQVVTNTFYPVSDIKTVKNEQITSTNDGAHVLGAASTPAVVNDLSTVNLPYTTVCPPAPITIPQNYFPSTNTVHALTGITSTGITGVVASSNSDVAFVTYTGTGGLPMYVPSTGTASTLTLNGAATDPLAGVFASNDAFFYVDTAGDNAVHVLTMTYPTSGAPTAVDTQTISPLLPDANGNIVAPNMIVQRVKKPTT